MSQGGRCSDFATARARVAFFFVLLFFIWLVSKEDIGGY